jgi:hypothetical protein
VGIRSGTTTGVTGSSDGLSEISVGGSIMIGLSGDSVVVGGLFGISSLDGGIDVDVSGTGISGSEGNVDGLSGSVFSVTDVVALLASPKIRYSRSRLGGAVSGTMGSVIVIGLAGDSASCPCSATGGSTGSVTGGGLRAFSLLIIIAGNRPLSSNGLHPLFDDTNGSTI